MGAFLARAKALGEPAAPIGRALAERIVSEIDPDEQEEARAATAHFKEEAG